MFAQPSHRNAFLAELSARDYELFRTHLTNFNLDAGQRLQNVGSMVEQVVFPHSGVAAMTMPLQTGGGGGAILAGRDGIIGSLEAAAAAPAACDAEVYIAGQAVNMSASSFRYVLDERPTIRRLVARYNLALMMQAHQAALCNAAHPVEARLARWLLEVQDRSSSYDITLTQNTLSHMLGVQRTTVNSAAGRLEASGVITCGRGHIQIIQRERLEAHACECYRNARSYFSSLLTRSAASSFSATPAEAVRAEGGLTREPSRLSDANR